MRRRAHRGLDTGVPDLRLIERGRIFVVLREQRCRASRCFPVGMAQQLARGFSSDGSAAQPKRRPKPHVGVCPLRPLSLERWKLRRFLPTACTALASHMRNWQTMATLLNGLSPRNLPDRATEQAADHKCRESSHLLHAERGTSHHVTEPRYPADSVPRLADMTQSQWWGWRG